MNSRATHVRLAPVRPAEGVGKRGLHGVDRGLGHDLPIGDAAALRIHGAREVGRGPRVGDRREKAASEEERVRRSHRAWTVACAAILAIGCSGKPAQSAEAACAGVSNEEAAGGITRFTVERAEPETRQVSQKELPALVGARLYVRPTEKLTPEWLSRVLSCHMTKRMPCPSNESCPLEVGKVEVDVSSAGTAFVVLVTSSDPASAREVLRRGKALAAAH
jgi:hypothetical protein